MSQSNPTQASANDATPAASGLVDAAREKAHRALDDAERAWYAYAGQLDVGPDRIHAFEVYDRVRQARRVGS